MNNFNKQALSEVIEVLNHTESDIINKIPKKFISFLFDNMDKTYKVNIDFLDDNWDKNILEDTKAILAIIYRDYVLTQPERQLLLEEEKNERIKQEQILREKYNPDNIFKHHPDNKDSEHTLENKYLVEVKESSWYKKIIRKILDFFIKH